MAQWLRHLLLHQKVRGSISGSNSLCSCHCGGSNSHMQSLEVHFHCLPPRLSDETLNRVSESIASWSQLVKLKTFLSTIFLFICKSIGMSMISGSCNHFFPKYASDKNNAPVLGVFQDPSGPEYYFNILLFHTMETKNLDTTDI